MKTMTTYLELAKMVLVNRDDGAVPGEIVASSASVLGASPSPNSKMFQGIGRVLTWASHLAEQDLVLSTPVSYIEAELRTVTTDRVSSYAAQYLATIIYARLQQETGGWGLFTSSWWKQREQEAIAALVNLRQALLESGEMKP